MPEMKRISDEKLYQLQDLAVDETPGWAGSAIVFHSMRMCVDSQLAADQKYHQEVVREMIEAIEERDLRDWEVGVGQIYRIPLKDSEWWQAFKAKYLRE